MQRLIALAAAFVAALLVVLAALPAPRPPLLLSSFPLFLRPHSVYV